MINDTKLDAMNSELMRTNVKYLIGADAYDNPGTMCYGAEPKRETIF